MFAVIFIFSVSHAYQSGLPDAQNLGALTKNNFVNSALISNASQASLDAAKSDPEPSFASSTLSAGANKTSRGYPNPKIVENSPSKNSNDLRVSELEDRLKKALGRN